MLSEPVAKLIQEAVRIGGAELEGKLPPKPYLKKRNPYAHLYERIKAKMGRPYTVSYTHLTLPTNREV